MPFHFRWYLRREREADPDSHVMLVVEERASPFRGYTCAVSDRAHAREMLPVLRAQLALSLGRPAQVRTYDVEEA